MKNEILNIPNESTLDTNFEKQMNNSNYLNFDNLSEKSNYEENKLDNDIDTTTNCLALTIKDDYHLVAVKNFFRKGFRVSWKIALSMFTINFLNMFL